MRNAKLVKVSSNHKELSQDEYNGEYRTPPTVGRVFVFNHRVGRCIRTTPVDCVVKNIHTDVITFWTKNSVYRLEHEQAPA
jgi:hypothetical protein